MVILGMLIGSAGDAASAAASDPPIRLQRQNGRFSIAAADASLKNVLFRLAEAAGISIKIATSLDRRVTIEQSGLSLKSALDRLLKGINHVIIYSGDERTEAAITRVLVWSKAKPRPPQTPAQKRLAARVAGYQRQIRSLERRLADLDANSRRAARYQRRIERLRQSIRRLQNQRY